MDRGRTLYGGPKLAGWDEEPKELSNADREWAEAALFAETVFEGRVCFDLRDWSPWREIPGTGVRLRARVTGYDPEVDRFDWQVELRTAAETSIELLYRVGDPEEETAGTVCYASLRPGDAHVASAWLENGRSARVHIDAARVRREAPEASTA